MKATIYNYNISGGYSDTVATLADGRRVWVCTQSEQTTVRHSGDCAISKQTAVYPKAVCTCGSELSPDDKAELIADARLNGKFGKAPKTANKAESISELKVCSKCKTVCYGDCEA